MQILVKTLAGQILPVDCEPLDLVSTVKNKISDLGPVLTGEYAGCQWETTRLRLLFYSPHDEEKKGEDVESIMTNERTLASFGISDGDLVMLFFEDESVRFSNVTSCLSRYIILCHDFHMLYTQAFLVSRQIPKDCLRLTQQKENQQCIFFDDDNDEMYVKSTGNWHVTAGTPLPTNRDSFWAFEFRRTTADFSMSVGVTSNNVAIVGANDSYDDASFSGWRGWTCAMVYSGGNKNRRDDNQLTCENGDVLVLHYRPPLLVVATEPNQPVVAQDETASFFTEAATATSASDLPARKGTLSLFNTRSKYGCSVPVPGAPVFVHVYMRHPDQRLFLRTALDSEVENIKQAEAEGAMATPFASALPAKSKKKREVFCKSTR